MGSLSLYWVPLGVAKARFLISFQDYLSQTLEKFISTASASTATQGISPTCSRRILLLPWRTVLRNVLIGPEIHDEPLNTAEIEAQQRLAQLGLSGFEHSYPMQLSGGMRQRVALVRTLLFRKEILLLDEPFGALDAMTRTVMQSILLDIWSESRQTVLLITHDVEEALLLADKIYILTARPATLKAELPVPLSRPRNITDASLIGLKKELLALLQVEMSKVFDTGAG